MSHKKKKKNHIKMLPLMGGGIFFFLGIVIISAFAGGGAQSAAPVQVVATEDMAYEYQFIGTELGVPWDIAMLVDAVRAKDKGAGGIEDYNPFPTSLEFCIITEEKYIPVEEETEDSTEEETEEPTEESEESTEEEIEWELVETKDYMGLQGVVDYTNIKVDNLDYTYATQLVTDVVEIAEEKTTKEEKYIAMIYTNINFEEVLRDFLKLEEDDIEGVLELFESQYLLHLYGFGGGDFNIKLPDLVVGDVSRLDLGKVAISLLNHPYLLGGKSPAPGSPTGPLDCSGFVDWVYIQCFGVGVSGGQIPDGIAVSGTAQQFYATKKIKERELKIGDLGFLHDPSKLANGTYNHVGIYLGKVGRKNVFIHCAGRSYGTSASPRGRVGISFLSGSNDDNPINGVEFEPPMKGCNFRYFRQPNFKFNKEE